MNLYETVTREIVTALGRGTLPWRKPWGAGGESTLLLPQNACTGWFYSGINIPILWMKGYDSPFWATKKTWNKLKASVNEGEVPAVIYYRHMATHQVFNLAQVTGCDYLRQARLLSENYTPAEILIQCTEARIEYSGSKALYCVKVDKIYCPPRREFKTMSGYYTTLFHEIVHWTGHPHRLNRKVGWPEDSDEYRFEELVGELGGCFLASVLELPNREEELPNQAGYIQSYRQLLSGDSHAFFRACEAASGAVNYLLTLGGVDVSGNRSD